MATSSRRRPAIVRWGTRVLAVCALIGLAFACAPLLGIEDVGYGSAPDDNEASTDGGGGGNPDGSSLVDGMVVCNPPQVACGSKCVNLTNDNSNCGKCGYTCSCGSGKCLVEPLGTALGPVHFLAVDDASVYVTVLNFSGPGSVISIALDGGAVTKIADQNVDAPAAILERAGRLAWASNTAIETSATDGGDRQSVPVNGGNTFFGLDELDERYFSINAGASPQIITMKEVSAAPYLQFEIAQHTQNGRVVTHDDAHVYWSILNSVGDGGAIGVAPRTFPYVPSASLGPPDANAWGLAVDNDYIYYTDYRIDFGPSNSVSEAGTVQRMKKDGTSRVTLISGLNSPRIIIVDGDRIYVGEFGDLTDQSVGVLEFAIDGGGRQSLHTARGVIGMVLANGYLYWADNTDHSVSRLRVR